MERGAWGGGGGGVLQKRQSPDFMSPELLTKSFYLNSTTFFGVSLLSMQCTHNHKPAT